MKQEWKIIQASTSRTASTVLSNILYGLIDPYSPISQKGEGSGDIKKSIVVTHNTDIDGWIDRLGEEFTLFFIMSERKDKKRTIKKKDRDKDNVLVFDFNDLNETLEYSVADIVQCVHCRLKCFLPEYILLNKELAVLRLICMNALYDCIKDKPFSYCENFFHLHGSHRNR